MSGHRITADLLKADTALLDPGDTGKLRAEDWVNVFELVSAGTEARTLANPVKSGQILIITLKTHAGTLTITADTGYNKDGDTTLAFDAALETILLVSVPNGTSGYRWSSLGVVSGTEDAPTFG